MTTLRDETEHFLRAVQFLTRLPTPARSKNDIPHKESLRYYPLVGALIGAICAAILYGAAIYLPVLIAVLVSTAAGVLLTGALHEDGLADTFDGIGGGATRERKLEIMRDSQIGTYGVLALGFTIATKVAALVAMTHGLAIISLVCAHSLSRLSTVLVIFSGRYARTDGAAATVSEGLSRPGLHFSLLSGALFLILLALATTVWTALLALSGLTIGVVIMRHVSEKKLGGYTGDTLGAIQQVSELGFYVGVLVAKH